MPGTVEMPMGSVIQCRLGESTRVEHTPDEDQRRTAKVLGGHLLFDICQGAQYQS